MNWGAIGAIGELVGAAAVVLTLAYLAKQIRNQTVESKISAQAEITDRWNTIMGDLARERSLADTFERGIRGSNDLTPTELVQFYSHLTRFFRSVESVYRQNQANRLDKSTWVGIENMLQDFCCYPGVRDWWKSRGHWHSSDFQDWLDPFMTTSSSPNMYGESGGIVDP